MKKLIALISTKGKTSEQVGKEGWEAFKKYQKLNKHVENKIVDVTLQNLDKAFVI